MTRAAARNATTPPLSPGKVLGILAFAISLVVLLLIYLSLNKPAGREIAETYGRRRGNGGAESVNGTAVLASMFEASGRKVSTITMLGNTAQKFDTIVWIPNSTQAPSIAVEDFFERWLREGSNRTLIYIGRDYDASPKYWQTMANQVEPQRREEYERRWAQAKSRADAKSAAFPEKEDASWFTILASATPRKIDSLDGPWANGIDIKQADLELATRLDLPQSTTAATAARANRYEDSAVEILLQSENDILAHSFTRDYWTNSQVIVLANGSFTLNLPLVNKEHRKLAGRVVSACASQGSVAFLESDEAGPQVRKNEREGGTHALHLFTVWPISFIFIHFAALGIAYCISSFHIFGRPHRLPKEKRSDFGQHVAALGALLKKTRNVPYAESRVRTYLQQSRRASGKSHARTPAETSLLPLDKSVSSKTTSNSTPFTPVPPTGSDATTP
jgi:hypothetical protein